MALLYNMPELVLTKLVFLLLLQGVLSNKKCSTEKTWYDSTADECRPCSSCLERSLELRPCSEFTNTMCVDLPVFHFNFDSRPETVSSEGNDLHQIAEVHHPWHEMETKDDQQMLAVQLAQVKQQQAPRSDFQHVEWGVAAVVVLCITVTTVLCAVAVLMIKHSHRFGNRGESRKVAARARLFSRDRLNTTEYMHNLATLDRRLAMDEILEKRKKAIFEPQLLCENVYTDDVFVDISGLPPEYDHNPADQHREHELSLLNTRERQ